jgi:N-acetylneuraminic acid mutarotase
VLEDVVESNHFEEDGAKKRRTVVKKTPKQKIVLFGGYDGKTYMNDVWICDPNNIYDWMQINFEKDDLCPVGRAKHTATIHGNQMYVFGGRNDKTLNDLWYLDLGKIRL